MTGILVINALTEVEPKRRTYIIVLGLDDCAIGRPYLAAAGGPLLLHINLYRWSIPPLPYNCSIILKAPLLFAPSDMFHPTNDISSNLGPINAGIQLLVDKPTDSDILPSYEIQPVADLCARFFVIRRSYDALNGLGEDKVGDLIAGKKSAREGSPVSGEDEYLFWQNLD